MNRLAVRNISFYLAGVLFFILWNITSLLGFLNYYIKTHQQRQYKIKRCILYIDFFTPPENVSIIQNYTFGLIF